MPPMATLARAFLACAVVAASSPVRRPLTSRRAAAKRIVAVADVRGDLDAFVDILQRAQ
jgi:hypothetical protein